MNRKSIVSTISAIALSLTITPSALAKTAALQKVQEVKQQSEQQVQRIDKQASKKVLMAKLATLNFFSANFSQEVISDSGELLDQSTGKLAISKPNLANWQTIEPNELSIVSDGSNVWFYDAWLEQVSVYSLSAAIAQTPILLLTSQDESLWQQYNVTQHKEIFVVTAKNTDSQVQSLTLVFESNEGSIKGNVEQLSQFTFLDATGQKSNIKLSHYDAKNAPEAALFNFVIPNGVQVDDQRVN